MEAFALYLLKSVIWLTGFALVYFLFLQNERYFQLKRIYLASGILISLLFPIFTIHYSVEIPSPAAVPQNLMAGFSGTVAPSQPQPEDSQFDLRLIPLLIYIAGLIFLAVRLIRQIIRVIRVIRRSKIGAFRGTRLVSSPDTRGSFSFFRFVFIDPSVRDSELEMIMNHELVHVNQRHWLDLMLAELIRLLQWINPVAWIYSGFIRQNHEYIADEEALRKVQEPAVYKAVLVNQLAGERIFSLSNSFGYSLNKKRFDMMKKTITSPWRKIKVLLVLPVFAIVFYAFATPEYHYSNVANPQSVSMTDNMQPVTDQPVSEAQKDAKGVVLGEDGKPLKGVTIIVSNSTMMTTTDTEGKFSLSRMPDGSSLIFTYKGYKTYILPPLISSNMALRIKLVKDPDYKEQVVVRSAAEGSQENPLFVINGVISAEGIKALEPEAIESVVVLKDEAAINKYGENGKNGVVEIVTKSPQAAIQKTVKGTVTDEEGKPLGGINVGNTGRMGYARGTSTGPDGRFELSIPSDASLMFSGRGYKPVTMKPDFMGEMTVKMEKAPIRPQQPEPLVVIDGVITGKKMQDAYKELGYNFGLSKMLMGKDATEKYGDKGANGVVEITTRKKALEMGLNPPIRRLAPGDYPTFQGKDWMQFTEWVTNQLKYPEEAQQKKAEGYVTVNFNINMDGTLSDIRSFGSVDPSLSNEVMNVVKSSPQWDPPRNPEIKEPFPSSVTVGFKLPDKIIDQMPFVVVEEMPQYPGGEGELLKFIQDNLKYPEEAKARKIEGKVIIRFVVNTEGKTEGISVLKGIDPLLDAEAVRIVGLLSGWKPGMQGGKPVPVWYMVPVNFILPNPEKQ